jgi:hypothetical protein
VLGLNVTEYAAAAFLGLYLAEPGEQARHEADWHRITFCSCKMRGNLPVFLDAKGLLDLRVANPPRQSRAGGHGSRKVLLPDVCDEG